MEYFWLLNALYVEPLFSLSLPKETGCDIAPKDTMATW